MRRYGSLITINPSLLGLAALRGALIYFFLHECFSLFASTNFQINQSGKKKGDF